MNAQARTARISAPKKLTPTYPPAQTAITIALDTKYLIAQPPGTVGAGIYMFDNRLTNDSTGEGTLELTTSCNAGDIISFQVVAINQLDGTVADSVRITGFNVSSGNVFGGSQGQPVQASTDGSYWLAQAVNQGRQTYQIYVEITTNGLHPITRDISWDPFIIAQ